MINKKKQLSTPEWSKLDGSELVKDMIETFRPRDDDARRRGEDLIRSFMERLVRESGLAVSTSVVRTMEAWIASIDSQLSDQVNEIMHAQEFQRLEAAWRGLNQLVMNTETSNTLKLKVMNASKEELIKDFDKAVEFTESALWKKVYQYEYGVYGGDPFGVLLGDYEFGKGSRDVKLLEDIAKVAAASHAPFIAGTGPEMFGMERFTEIPDPRDLKKKFDKSDPNNIKWLSFRDSEDARFVGLCLPHVLMRSPYGKENPVESFRFEEDVSGDHLNYLWGNAAYPFVNRITESFAKFHWSAHIRGPEGGGLVSGLPIHIHRTNEGNVAAKCPTEVLIPDDREKELSDVGFIALCHCKNTDYAAFFGANSAQKPKVYNTDYATANAKISSQLEYLFVTCRIAHYLKSICRDKTGKFMSAQDTEKFLNKWIEYYVLDQDNATDEQKAERPLRKARVEVQEDPRRPGCYKAVAYVRPHFHLDEIDIALMLVAELPPPAKKPGA